MSFDKKAWAAKYRPKWRAANKERLKEYDKMQYQKNRDKHRKWGMEWRKNNKDYIKAKHAEWVTSNPEKYKAIRVRTYQKNRDKIKAATKAYYLKNKDIQDDKARIFREKNKEKIHTRQQEWYKENYHIAIMGANRRRAKLVGATIGDPSTILAWEKDWRSREIVKCHWCKCDFNPKRCHADHIVAIHLGGPHSIDNLCISCQPCNNRKHAKPLDRWIQELARTNPHV